MTETARLVHSSTLRDFLVLSDVEAIRTLAHTERLEMLALLAERPHTATSIARRLGMEPNRAHYHLQRLVAAGLVHPAGHGRKRWKEERFFVAAARHLLVDPALACSDAETSAAVLRGIESGILDWRRRAILDIDLGQIARIAIQDALRVRAGERVMVFFAPAALELAECMLVEIEALGAFGRLKPWSRNSILRTLDRHDDASLARRPFASEDEDRDLAAVAFIGQMMPQGAPPDAAQRAKLPAIVESLSRWQRSLRARGVRYLEFGLPWRGEFTFGDVVPEDAIDAYWRSLITDADVLRERARGLTERMGTGGAGAMEPSASRTVEFTVTTRGGSTLRLAVDAARAVVSDGVIDPGDIAAGRTSESMPAGALVFLPGPGTGDGTFRGEYVFTMGRHFRDVCVALRAGRIIELTAANDQELLRGRIREESGETDRLSMISIGLNPAGIGPTGKSSLDSCSEGTITISFGNNEIWGGDVRSSLDLQLPAFGASLSSSGAGLVKAGRLVLDGQDGESGAST